MSQLSKFTDDELITELENRGRINAKHTVQIRIADFSMKHTLRCHPDLFNCDIHKRLNDLYLDNGGFSPFQEGIYNIDDKTMKLTPI